MYDLQLMKSKKKKSRARKRKSTCRGYFLPPANALKVANFKDGLAVALESEYLIIFLFSMEIDSY